MPKIVSNCEHCNARIEFWPSQARRFCSMSCRTRWHVDNGIVEMPRKPRRGETVPCESCGEPVYRTAREAANGKRYCSTACQNDGNRKAASATCDGCGTTYSRVPSQTGRRFCTRECYETHRIRASGIGRFHNGREVIKDGGGYLRIWEPTHPAANQGRVLEHRWLVEQQIGRFLLTEEHVHHVNGVKDDNRLENLRLLGAQEHRLLTAAEIKQQRADDAAELAEYRRRFGPLT